MSCTLTATIDGSSGSSVSNGLNEASYHCSVDNLSDSGIGAAATLQGSACVPDISSADYQQVDGITVNTNHGTAGTNVENAIALPRTNAVAAIEAAAVKLSNQLSGAEADESAGYLWLSGYTDVRDVCEKINREEEQEHLQELSLANPDAADNFFGNFMGVNAASAEQYVAGYDNGATPTDELTEESEAISLKTSRRLRKEPCTLCD